MPVSIEDLLSRLREDRLLFLGGEEATRQGAILPILGQLGWDRDNVREVVPEYAVGNGRVDYCLKIGETNAVFIEVKRTNEELDRHQEQLLDYAFREGVKIAVLTNALLWWLYLPLLEGSWDQRKFFAIDIQQQEVEAASRHFREFLSREAVANGSAVERARSLHAGRERDRRIRETIPRAWQQLVQEPDELLLDLLADRVESLCGHRPGQELLAEYLADATSGSATPPTAPPTLPRPRPRDRAPRSGEPDRRLYTNMRAVAYTFGGQRRGVSTFKEVLIGLCQDLYRVHGTDFGRVLTLRGRRRAYFSRDSRGMTSPQEIPGSGIYAETNLSANSIMDQCNNLLGLFGYSRNQLQVEVEDR